MSTVVQDLQRATAGINDIETALKSAGAIGESEVVPIEDYDDKIGTLAKTLVQKTITANGVYLPSNEQPPADGYSGVTVTVPMVIDIEVAPISDQYYGDYVCSGIRKTHASQKLGITVAPNSDSDNIRLAGMISNARGCSLKLKSATYDLTNLASGAKAFEIKPYNDDQIINIISLEGAFNNVDFVDNSDVDLTFLKFSDITGTVSLIQAFQQARATNVKLDFTGFNGTISYGNMFENSRVVTVDGIRFDFAGNGSGTSDGVANALAGAANLVNLNIVQGSVIGNDTDDVTFNLTDCTMLDGASFLSRLGTFTGTHTVTINFAADVYNALTQADIDAATAKNYIITHA